MVYNKGRVPYQLQTPFLHNVQVIYPPTLVKTVRYDLVSQDTQMLLIDSGDEAKFRMMYKS